MIKSALIIAGCPRSGTSLLYNILSEIPSLWSIGFESKKIIERYHHPEVNEWVSGVLDEKDLTNISQNWMLKAFEHRAAPGNFWRRVNRFRSWMREKLLWQRIKKSGQKQTSIGAIGSVIPQRGVDIIRNIVIIRNFLVPIKRNEIQLLEKTPENCLRLPFLEALFPEIKVIFLIRDGRSNVFSLMEGWRQPYLFPGYKVPKRIRIPGYNRDRWAFTLIPGWDDLLHNPLEEVCAQQWIQCNQAVIDHESTGNVPYLRVRYEDLISQPYEVIQSISSFIEVPIDENFRKLKEGLPNINILSSPQPKKWLQERKTIEHVLPLMKNTMKALGYS
jgi:hypothetical protein